jgi:hypothetical protein
LRRKRFETWYIEGGHSSVRVGLAGISECEVREITNSEENSEFCFVDANPKGGRGLVG